MLVYWRPILGGSAALLLVILALWLMPKAEHPLPATDQHVRTLPYIPTPAGENPSTATVQPDSQRQ
ncbi:hypothetical protein [Nocardia sp. XZ_19_369]|uniref:hypothetical protein n=1 Tax=Nocardia sp. XZ_19_369 TaxID=2769487 RepID=UPI00188E3B4E|nr:hypothetical protein [Nocardia sp. XZ_19_369]